ncbi:YisL family protein [Bacillus spongiae]|uniref:UPF0344 protein WAK64_05425 n=1 Tax=Bacillus spongiae TaxID=2683610 RepID=A0ABU8HB04_9BACI
MVNQTHAHITTWVIALILFFVAFALHRSGKAQGMKVVHMVLRLFYLLIIITGGVLFINHQTIQPAVYGMKMLVGLLVIGMMEMVLVRLTKNKSTRIAWILFVVSFIAALYLGYVGKLGF